VIRYETVSTTHRDKANREDNHVRKKTASLKVMMTQDLRLRVQVRKQQLYLEIKFKQ